MSVNECGIYSEGKGEPLTCFKQNSGFYLKDRILVATWGLIGRSNYGM